MSRDRRKPNPVVHAQVTVQIVSSRGHGPTFVLLRSLDLTDPEKAERVEWLRLSELLGDGHAIANIGSRLKPYLIEALRLAGIGVHSR